LHQVEEEGEKKGLIHSFLEGEKKKKNGELVFLSVALVGGIRGLPASILPKEEEGGKKNIRVLF